MTTIEMLLNSSIVIYGVFACIMIRRAKNRHAQEQAKQDAERERDRMKRSYNRWIIESGDR